MASSPDQRLSAAIGALPTDAAQARAVEDQYQVPTYGKYPIVLARGQGAWVEDVAGVRYLDLYGGHCVALAGHCHPRIVAAIQAQAERLLFYSNVLYVDVRARAAKALATLAPEGLQRVFLCSTGTEANETALKIARKFTGRQVVVSASESFHGRTLGALGATGIPTYRDPAYPVPTCHRYAPHGDRDAWEAALRDDVAAVILEPMPSMGGIRAPARDWMRWLRTRTQDLGALLIFDEVQTGFGRTGTMFYGEHDDVTPDLITGAKGVAGGFPAGVTFVREDIAAGMQRGEQGTTFGGGPLAAAALAATAAVLRDEDLPARAQATGEALADALRGLAGVASVEGRGLLRGIELDRPAKPVVQALVDEHQILTGTCGGRANQIRLMPPLTVDLDDALQLVPALQQVLGT